MRVEHWKHEGVNELGHTASGGSVGINPEVTVLWKGEACDCSSCNGVDCYIRVNLGRDDQGVVKGMTMYFTSDQELNRYLKVKGFLHLAKDDNPIVKSSAKYGSDYTVEHGVLLHRPLGGTNDEWAEVDFDRTFSTEPAPVGEYTELEEFEREMTLLFGRRYLEDRVLHFKGVTV